MYAMRTFNSTSSGADSSSTYWSSPTSCEDDGYCSSSESSSWSDGSCNSIYTSPTIAGTLAPVPPNTPDPTSARQLFSPPSPTPAEYSAESSPNDRKLTKNHLSDALAAILVHASKPIPLPPSPKPAERRRGYQTYEQHERVEYWRYEVDYETKHAPPMLPPPRLLGVVFNISELDKNAKAARRKAERERRRVEREETVRYRRPSNAGFVSLSRWNVTHAERDTQAPKPLYLSRYF